jgi:hypothetical protein
MSTRKCNTCGVVMAAGDTVCSTCGTRYRKRWPGRLLALCLLAGLAGAGYAKRDTLRNWWNRASAPAKKHPLSVNSPPPQSQPEPEPDVPPATAPATPRTAGRAAPELTPVPVSAQPVSAAPHGFRPPARGSRIRVRLAGGRTLHGTLQHLTADTVTLTAGTATLTLSRRDLAMESRAQLFAADFAAGQTAKHTAPRRRGAGPKPGPKPKTTSGEKDIADVFFDAFK